MDITTELNRLDNGELLAVTKDLLASMVGGPITDILMAEIEKRLKPSTLLTQIMDAVWDEISRRYRTFYILSSGDSINVASQKPSKVYPSVWLRHKEKIDVSVTGFVGDIKAVDNIHIYTFEYVASNELTINSPFFESYAIQEISNNEQAHTINSTRWQAIVNGVNAQIFRNKEGIDLRSLAQSINRTAHEKGWYDNGSRNIGEILMLMTSELAEALEEWRVNGDVTNLYVSDSGKPEGFLIELADCLIRILDTAAEIDIDLFLDGVKRKLTYNAGRTYRHGNKNG